jgi:hypothetical protein
MRKRRTRGEEKGGEGRRKRRGEGRRRMEKETGRGENEGGEGRRREEKGEIGRI